MSKKTKSDKQPDLLEPQNAEPNKKSDALCELDVPANELDYITGKSPWMVYNETPTGKSKKTKRYLNHHNQTGSGVYQIIHKNDRSKIEDDDTLIGDFMGYIGYASNMPDRVSGVQTGKHDVGKAIKQMKLGPDDVMIRFLFTENTDKARDLETYLHEVMNDTFGYRFKWKEASGGTSGYITHCIHTIDKMTDPQQIQQVAQHALEKWRLLMWEATMEGDLTGFVNQYYGDSEDE